MGGQTLEFPDLPLPLPELIGADNLANASPVHGNYNEVSEPLFPRDEMHSTSVSHALPLPNTFSSSSSSSSSVTTTMTAAATATTTIAGQLSSASTSTITSPTMSTLTSNSTIAEVGLVGADHGNGHGNGNDNGNGGDKGREEEEGGEEGELTLPVLPSVHFRHDIGTPSLNYGVYASWDREASQLLQASQTTKQECQDTADRTLDHASSLSGYQPLDLLSLMHEPDSFQEGNSLLRNNSQFLVQDQSMGEYERSMLTTMEQDSLFFS